MHNPRRPAPASAPDRGAAAVEMALVLPLLLLLVFGVIDFGRMFNAQLTLTEAAREGARAAAVGGDAQQQVRLASPQLDGVRATVVDCPTRQQPGVSNTTVTTTYQFEFVTPLAAVASIFGGDLDGTFPLTGKGVMMCGR